MGQKLEAVPDPDTPFARRGVGLEADHWQMAGCPALGAEEPGEDLYPGIGQSLEVAGADAAEGPRGWDV